METELIEVLPIANTKEPGTELRLFLQVHNDGLQRWIFALPLIAKYGYLTLAEAERDIETLEGRAAWVYGKPRDLESRFRLIPYYVSPARDKGGRNYVQLNTVLKPAKKK